MTQSWISEPLIHLSPIYSLHKEENSLTRLSHCPNGENMYNLSCLLAMFLCGHMPFAKAEL